MRSGGRALLGLITGLALTSAGCSRVEEIGQMVFGHSTARERYQARLEFAGLATTGAGRDWLDAGRRALVDAPLVTLPWSEQGYLPPAEPAALAYRIDVRRGQEVDFDLELEADSGTLIFVDVWQVTNDTIEPLRHLASADSGSSSLHFEPRRDGAYIIRAQPELLRGGRFTASLRIGPMLAFPVERGLDSDIGSDFGDPRDGGVRDHHGIDIFAPRGTPALAAAPATVSRVEVTPRGGKVVWLRDRRGHSLYYAHLDSQVVVAGARVQIGDTIGFVGNTGNARTTPPHLHFGVYSRGPVDPYWFVRRISTGTPRLTADVSLLGAHVRVTGDAAVLRNSVGGPPVERLARNTVARVLGAAGSWYRVRLPDGASGYVTAAQTERADRELVRETVVAATPLQAGPVEGSAIIAEVASGDTVAVLGRFRDYLFVRAPGGRDGWVIATQPPS